MGGIPPLHIKEESSNIKNFYLYLRISLVRIVFIHLESSMIFVSQNSFKEFFRLLFYVQYYTIHMGIHIGATIF